MRESGTSQGSRNIHRRVIISDFSWLTNDFDKHLNKAESKQKCGLAQLAMGRAKLNDERNKSKTSSMTGAHLEIVESPFSSADN